MTRILDAQGRPLKTRTATAEAVVFVSDDAENWTPVMAYNLPDWVKNDDVMSDMLAGIIVSLEETGPFYKAERSEPQTETIQ